MDTYQNLETQSNEEVFEPSSEETQDLTKEKELSQELATPIELATPDDLKTPDSLTGI